MSNVNQQNIVFTYVAKYIRVKRWLRLDVRWRMAVIGATFVMLGVCEVSVAAHTHYRLPLKDDYEIWGYWSGRFAWLVRHDANAPFGRTIDVLGKRFVWKGDFFPPNQQITLIDTFAMRDNIIFGRSEEDFFVVELPSNDKLVEAAKVWHLPDEESWRTKLAEFGVWADTPLANPREIAAKMPYQEVAHGIMWLCTASSAKKTKISLIG